MNFREFYEREVRRIPIPRTPVNRSECSPLTCGTRVGEVVVPIYFAGPLFSEAERSFNSRLTELLERANYQVFLP
jgi:hypothetical protein